jgi:hypothetical protein
MSKAALIALFAIALVPFGCAKHPSTISPTPTSLPTRLFDRPDLGVHLIWPVGWETQPSQDFVLMLVPTGAISADTSISLDVPKLPPHIPGLIPIGSVRNGYLDDLKKSVGKLDTKDLPQPGVPDAIQRLVRSQWTDGKGVAQQETALLMVHNDGVYILRGRSAISDETKTRGAFDEIVRSMQWISKNSPSPSGRGSG